MRCLSSRRVTTGLLLSFLTVLPTTLAAEQEPLKAPTNPSVPSNEHIFTLRQIFHRGTYLHPNLHKRLDIHPDFEFVKVYDDEWPEAASPPRLKAKSNPLKIERLADRRHERIADHLAYSSLTGEPRVLGAEHWTLDELPAPNITDKETVVNLAIMAANTYQPKPGQGNWLDVKQGFNLSTPFGWESDGLRGYIFADEGNKTVIVAIKGTSPAVFDGDGTTTKDKVNDNLFFSCCCGQGGRWLWKQACDCMTDTYTCNNTCLVKALKKKTRYYSAALELYTNVTALYPDSNTWITGHSLGGSISAMIGLTYGLPVVSYEAPGDDLAARRLGLPIPGSADPRVPYMRRYTGAYHFGHTADPIYMGTCNGVTDLCTLGGYAMESKCHTGMTCAYDTVGDLGWRVSAMYHRIHDVIDDVLLKYEGVAKCVHDADCVDCFNWKYFESNGTTSSTTTRTSKVTPTTSSILTRTTICKTPGWWGCLDDSTSSPVLTTTYTTTSCAEPGWFGCNSEVNVTITTTTAIPTKILTTTFTATTCVSTGDDGCDRRSTTTITGTTTSTTCKTPGLFFGCWDKTTKIPTTNTATTTTTATSANTITTSISTASTTSVDSRSHTTQTTSPKTTTTCKVPGIFWGCWDDPSTTLTTSHSTPTPAHSVTVPTPTASSTTSKLVSSTTSKHLPSTTSKDPKHPKHPKHSQDPDVPEKECKHPFFFGLFCLDSKR